MVYLYKPESLVITNPVLPVPLFPVNPFQLNEKLIILNKNIL